MHRLRAERALGRPLPRGVEVHHVDGTKSTDSPLVICQDRAYHMLLHALDRVRRAGGNPFTDRLCPLCQRVLIATAFAAGNVRGRQCYCRTCVAEQRRARRVRMKAKAS